MSSIWKYQHLLPVVAQRYRVELGEGETPLIRSKSIGASLGLDHLYFKLENLNPTGSYKDRFAAAFVSNLSSSGQQLCICTSSGNTGAALAAYCAAANIRCFVATVDGAPMPKVKQMQLYGAQIILVKDFGKDPTVTAAVFDTLGEFVAGRALPLPVSAYQYCPDGMAGVQTIGYELMEQLPGGPQHIFCPAGGGGLTLAVAKGVMAYSKGASPAVHCVQPEGNDTIAGPLREKLDKARPASASTTKISGLQVPSVLDGDEVIRHCRALNGTGFIVDDEAVFSWQKRLAQQEGIFSEPAGAVSLAGLAAAVKNGEVSRNEKIVCLVTGSGFKDMGAVEAHFDMPPIRTIDTVSGLANELLTL